MIVLQCNGLHPQPQLAIAEYCLALWASLVVSTVSTERMYICVSLTPVCHVPGAHNQLAISTH